MGQDMGETQRWRDAEGARFTDATPVSLCGVVLTSRCHLPVWCASPFLLPPRLAGSSESTCLPSGRGSCLVPLSLGTAESLAQRGTLVSTALGSGSGRPHFPRP